MFVLLGPQEEGPCTGCFGIGWNTVLFCSASCLACTVPLSAGSRCRQLPAQQGFALHSTPCTLPPHPLPPNPTTASSSPFPTVYGEIEFECGHWGVFENAIDMAHIHYLHADSFGNR